MKKTSTTKKKLTSFFIAFLAVALVFLALGLGTLGSFSSQGEDFELRSPVLDAGGVTQNSTVIFRLDSTVSETYTDEDGKEQTRSVNLEIDDVYLYVTAIYSEAGVPAGISLRSATGVTANFGRQSTASLENLFSREGEQDVQTDALYRWIHPFKIATSWAVSTYRYYELSATTANIRVSEVLFVGHPSASSANANREKYIIPATVASATPDTGETADEAKTRAEVLLDGDINLQARAYADSFSDDELKGTVAIPELPQEPASSYDAFTKAEIYSLLTITEMRAGDTYLTDANNRVTNVYHAENVYNVLGMDLVALGTEMFGVTPFGLRFMPMLFSFGILVLGFFFARELFSKKLENGERLKNDRAGFIFALLYALCDLSLALGHVGTPLTAGLFFLLLAAYLVDSFYRNGLKKVSLVSLAPLLFGGLAAAAAICVHGAMLIPVLGVCGLYVAAMLRQQKVNKLYLDRAIEACEASPADEEGKRDTSGVAKVVSENRYKNLAAGFVFPVALILGTLLFSILFILPVYAPMLKVYDDLTASTMNVFSLGWKTFIGGFVGCNTVADMPSEWNYVYRLFLGTGENRAMTAAIMNPIALLFGLLGIVYAVYKIVKISKNFKEEGKALRRILPLLAGLVISLITASFAGGALGFIFLAYIFAFLLGAYAADDCMNLEGKAGKTAKIVAIAALVLLLVCFALLAIFTFSVPVSSGFMVSFFQG